MPNRGSTTLKLPKFSSRNMRRHEYEQTEKYLLIDDSSATSGSVSHTRKSSSNNDENLDTVEGELSPHNKIKGSPELIVGGASFVAFEDNRSPVAHQQTGSSFGYFR